MAASNPPGKEPAGTEPSSTTTGSTSSDPAEQLAAWKAGAGRAAVASFDRAAETVRQAKGRAEALASEVNRKKERVDEAAAALRAAHQGEEGDAAAEALRAAQASYRKQHALFQDARQELVYVRGQARRAKAVVEAGFADWLSRGGGTGT